VEGEAGEEEKKAVHKRSGIMEYNSKNSKQGCAGLLE
jgi:hypothetical protein